MITLYSYWRSSAAYRLRIALNLKGLDYRYEAVNLLAGEHRQPAYLDINPAGLVPTLVTAEGQALTQTLAILQWLEDEYPEPALLPGNSLARARIRSLSATIACEIHPLNNMGVLNFLRDEYNASDEAVTQWMHHWLERGFKALEQQVSAAPYCAGDVPTQADVLLVPMVYNALRFGYPLAERQPRLQAIWEACNALPAFDRARPELQPDAG